MTGLDVILEDLDERWSDLTDRHVVSGRLEAVGAIPNGMSSGKAAVALRVELADGTVVLAETSLALLTTATRALDARHGDHAP